MLGAPRQSPLLLFFAKDRHFCLKFGCEVQYRATLQLQELTEVRTSSSSAVLVLFPVSEGDRLEETVLCSRLGRRPTKDNVIVVHVAVPAGSGSVLTRHTRMGCRVLRP